MALRSKDYIPVEEAEDGTTGVAVFVQDQTTPILEVPFLAERGTFTITADVSIGDRTFEASPGHGTTVGEVIELYNDLTFMQARVLTVVTNTIGIDSPINFAYTAGTNALRSTDDMRVNGSVTPQVFSVKPQAGQAGDVNRIILDIESNTAMDFTTFGSLAALVNGCVIRFKNKDGYFRNLWNWKTNGGFLNHGPEHGFQSKTGGGGFGLIAWSTFNGQEKRGVAIRLRGEFSEELQIVIQDNLSTGLTKFRVLAQGSELQV